MVLKTVTSNLAEMCRLEMRALKNFLVEASVCYKMHESSELCSCLAGTCTETT